MKLRTYLEIITLDLEEERNWRCSWDAENNIGTKFLYMKNCELVHRQAKDILPCKMDTTNADAKRNWYLMARKNIDQLIVHGSESLSTIKPKEG